MYINSFKIHFKSTLKYFSDSSILNTLTIVSELVWLLKYGFLIFVYTCTHIFIDLSLYIYICIIYSISSLWWQLCNKLEKQLERKAHRNNDNNGNGNPIHAYCHFFRQHVAHLLFYFLSIIAFWSNWGNYLLILYFKKLRMWSSSNEVLSQWQSQVEPSSSNLVSPDISVKYQLPLLRTIHLYWEELYNLESILFFGCYLLSFVKTVCIPNHAFLVILLEDTCIPAPEGPQC